MITGDRVQHLRDLYLSHMLDIKSLIEDLDHYQDLLNYANTQIKPTDDVQEIWHEIRVESDYLEDRLNEIQESVITEGGKCL